MLEDAAESFTQYLYVDKYLFALNPTGMKLYFELVDPGLLSYYMTHMNAFKAVGNGMFMLLFALATFIRFMIYVKNYHSKFDTPFEKFILASMVSTIFLVFATHALRQAFEMRRINELH